MAPELRQLDGRRRSDTNKQLFHIDKRVLQTVHYPPQAWGLDYHLCFVHLCRINALPVEANHSRVLA